MSMSWLSGLTKASFEPFALYVRYVLAVARVKKGSETRILYPGVISIQKGASMIVGRRCYIGAYSEIVVTGCNASNDQTVDLEIGDNTAIGAFANIRAHVNSIYIGNGVLIGQNVSIISSDHARSSESGKVSEYEVDEKTRSPIRIGDGAWLGAGSIILPGITIGRNAVVGAGSVVARNIGDGEVWIGYAAKRLS